MKVVVFGSINMDLVVTTPHLPKPGQTLIGHSFFIAPGGKGANQAVAAARLGIKTLIVGRVGNDSFSVPLLDNLRQNGVDVSQVQTDTAVSSGVALITVEETGENNIVIVPGANGRVDESDVARLESVIEPGDVLLLQLEVPLSAVVAAASLAAHKKATVILDPAPAQPLPDGLFALADLVTPNETEAGILAGISIEDNASAEAAVRVLHQRGARQVLLKMGGAGALWSTGDQVRYLAAFKVKAIDTVAAGDACNGGLAAGLVSGLPMAEALQWGLATGALATTKHGAQEAMPDHKELLDLLTTQTSNISIQS